ncbi:rRNA maturation protein [Methanosarcina sp. KYL-1]|uniref:rRNA maturation protein n=1 Tax=Methanosarcina sp. KYL-1 TaxID=2602068 RepID=UPI0021015335|nr:rRNA maturation protein [Methanosarcina sp. KYL-1]MCQ1536401.1 rRNA maturation protein [Methanosarcina sp. KYL-1]
MFITSSRKPSAKTRTLCKRLSRFTASRYVNRGKMGMQELLGLAEGEAFIAVGEYHGNPGELGFYGKAGQLLFSLRFTESASQEIDSYWFPETEPLLAGRGEIANALADFFPFTRVAYDKVEECPPGSTMMVVGDQAIDFVAEGKPLLRFNLKGFKRYDQ